MSNTKGSKNRNPCDYFMRELSINYPKGPEDEEKINKWMTRYQNEQEAQVRQEL